MKSYDARGVWFTASRKMHVTVSGKNEKQDGERDGKDSCADSVLQ